MKMISKLLPLLLLALLAGCTGPSVFEEQDGAPSGPVDAHSVPDAIPKYEPYSKYGNPASYEALGKTYYVKKSAKNHVERGIASWYGTKFHGRRTSSGEPYDMYKMTAAHKSLPIPSYAEVTNLENGRKIVVRINDRGPFKEGRIIDLSYVAAIKLGIDQKGTGQVEMRTITFDPPNRGVIALAAPQATPAEISRIEPLESSTRQQTFLQVGSFSEQQNMQRMVDRLNGASIKNIRVYSPDSDNTNYRVRIGPLANRNIAEQLANELTNKGFEQPYIVVD